MSSGLRLLGLLVALLLVVGACGCATTNSTPFAQTDIQGIWLGATDGCTHFCRLAINEDGTGVFVSSFLDQDPQYCTVKVVAEEPGRVLLRARAHNPDDPEHYGLDLRPSADGIYIAVEEHDYVLRFSAIRATEFIRRIRKLKEAEPVVQ